MQVSLCGTAQEQRHTSSVATRRISRDYYPSQPRHPQTLSRHRPTGKEIRMVSPDSLPRFPVPRFPQPQDRAG